MSFVLSQPSPWHPEVDETLHDETLHDRDAPLTRQWRRYQNLFDLSATAFLETDLHGRILAANEAASFLFAIPLTCLRGGVLSALVDRSDFRRFLDLLWRIRRGQSAVRRCLTMKGRRAKSFSVELRAVSQEGEEGAIILWSLHHAPVPPPAPSEAKDRTPASLVHELRTPLMPVMLAATMLEAEPPRPEQVRQSAELIRRNIERLARLIDEMLDSGITPRGTKLNPENVDLHRLLDDVVVLCQSDIRARRVDLQMELEAPRHLVRGDSVRLRQLFWNVLREAVRSSRPERLLLLRSRESADDRISIAIEIEGAAGFCPNLAVAGPLSEAHDGTICVESDERGATMVVALPLCESVPHAHQPLVRRRILLVDDHEDSAVTLARFLRRNGQHVAVAHSAAEAMRLARRHRFDVLICDLLLPDDSGYELLARLCGLGPLAAVAVSALGSAEDVERSERAGFARHLVKPVVPSQMLAVLADLEEAGEGRQ